MSNRNLVNPLQALVKTAGAQLPTKTGTVDRFAERLHRTDGPQILLADVSGSMDAPAWGDRRKIDVLREAVSQVRGQGTYRLITFSSAATDNVTEIPEPSGSTHLDLGLAAAAQHKPRSTLVISDGQPDDEKAALAEAERVTGRIDVLYVGPDGDRAAMDFLRRLARAGCGEFRCNDLAKAGQPALASTIGQLLLEHRR